MKKIGQGKGLLALGAALILLSLIQLSRAPALMQYAVAMPESVDATMLDAAKEELTGSADILTAHAERDGMTLGAGDAQSVQARLIAAGEDWFALYERFLLTGRLLSPDELRYGERVIVLDEDLALKLFGIAEPIDRNVTLGDYAYRVVGIARHTRQSGEHALYSAYAPLAQIQKDKLPLDTLVLSIAPLPQSGASSAFFAAVQSFGADGDLLDLNKECMRQTMLIRLCLVAAGCYLAAAFIRALFRHLIGRVRGWRERMRGEYLRDMLGQIIPALFGFLLGCAAAGGLCWALANFALEPVYLFPEWIPPVLVEWSDLRTTFWNLTTAASKPIRRLTSEYCAIAFWGVILRWGLISLLLGLTIGRFFPSKVRKPKE